MKTITEYQPLIVAALLDAGEKRRTRQKFQTRSAWRVAIVVLPLLYILAALKITSDTGLAVWNWQFWLMFIPLFLLGERVLWALSQDTRSALLRG